MMRKTGRKEKKGGGKVVVKRGVFGVVISIGREKKAVSHGVGSLKGRVFVSRFVFVFVVCCVKTGHAYKFLFVSIRKVDVSVLFGGFGYYALGRQLFS